jgi:sulfite reductase alpha subunit-like flavoprotein
VIDAMEFGAKDLASDTVTAFIMASYGEGIPTDNAKKFFSEVQNDTHDMKNSKYAVFGLGNSQCFQDRYNVVAKGLDVRLKRLGGNRILPIGLGDASKNNFKDFSDWKEKLLAAIESGNFETSDQPSDREPEPAAAAPSPSPTATPVCNPQPQPPTPSATCSSSFTATCSTPSSETVRREGVDVPLVLSARQLAMVPSDRHVLICKVSGTEQHFLRVDEMSSAMSVSFDISHSRSLSSGEATLVGEEYTAGLKAGDHIGVFAPNSSLVIARFAANAALTSDDLDHPLEGLSPNDSVTLRQLLMWQLQLSGVVSLTGLKVLERWAKESRMTVTAEHMRFLIDNYDAEVRARAVDVAGVLARIPRSPAFPALPLVALLKTLPPIAPRLYSMITNPPQHRLSATLLCRLLRYRDNKHAIVNGLCSSYLCERVKADDEAAIFFREAAFHLPQDPHLPVIMICGGTGIAPFLSFLEERQRVAKNMPVGEAMGPAVIYYGCRNIHEYMYREQLRGYLSEALQRLVVCFSSPSTGLEGGLEEVLGPACEGEEVCCEAMNITDVVTRDMDEHLVPLMRRDAHIYVCGGAGNFGKAVRANVEALVRKSYSEEELGGKEGVASNVDHYGVRYVVSQKRYFEDLAD